MRSISAQYLSIPRFRHLLNISEDATPDEIQAATTTQAASEIFKSRFLFLTVQFGSRNGFIELKDVAAFSADTMGAQIGGVLNLWLGVTVMFAFEAFEFFYVYLTKSRKEEPKAEAGRISVAPAVETRSSDKPTQINPIWAASNTLETELSQSVVVQIE